MVERKAFLTNPKNQNRVSQKDQYVYYAQSPNNGDYYENPSLSNLRDKHSSMYLNKENVFIVPNHERVEIISRIQVCPI